MNRASCSLLLLLALAVSGCADPSHPEALVGRWKIDATQGGMPHWVSTRSPEEQKQFATEIAPSMVMSLQAQGKATMAGTPGSWDADEQQLHVRATTPAGQASPSSEKDSRYVLEDGGKTLRTVSDGLEVVWRKQ